MHKVDEIVVMGGGSAGFCAALTLATRLPGLKVTVVRSPGIGIIGVGEGTVWSMPVFLHGYLGIPPATFHERVSPTYKLGIRFHHWGPRDDFYYAFEPQLDYRYDRFTRANGYHCFDDFGYAGIAGALMAHGRLFERRPDGLPSIPKSVAYHVENERFVEFLEQEARARGVQVIDATVEDVRVGPNGVEALQLDVGTRLTADLFVDATGFASQLLAKALGTRFVDFSPSLFCDRAVVGGWARRGEPLLPYTTAETMDAGWSWQIEHKAFINRGYVYSSRFIDDAAAEAEFRKVNPRVGETRVLRFPSGRHERTWVKNVVAVGNAAGFVEPMEATALMLICNTCIELVFALSDADRVVREPQVALFNRAIERQWDNVRRFLAVHYKFNTRRDTPFWQAVRADTDLAGAEDLVEYYRSVGPSIHGAELLGGADVFGLEGYLVLLVGQGVPFEAAVSPPARERREWRKLRAEWQERASAALTQEEALRLLRSDRWQWRDDFYPGLVHWR